MISDQERLRQLKSAPESPAVIKEFGIVSIYKEDFNWLMEQAEEKQKIEEYAKVITRDKDFFYEENKRLKDEKERLQMQIGREVT